MLGDFLVDRFVEFAIVNEDCFHLFYLLDDKGVLLYQGLHSNAAAYELLVNGYKIV